MVYDSRLRLSVVCGMELEEHWRKSKEQKIRYCPLNPDMQFKILSSEGYV